MEKVTAPPVVHAPPQAEVTGPAHAPLAAPGAFGDSGLTINFSPETGTQEEWNEAYARLADYFRALRIHSRLHRTILILETLRRAAKTHAAHPTHSPTAVAIHEARRMQREWMRGILGDLNISEGRLDVNGRLAFHLCDGPKRWPHYFLRSESLPPDMVEGMRVRIEQSGPDLAFSSMVPRDIDLALVPQSGEIRETFGKYPILRYLILLALALAVFWGIWKITHQG